MKLLLDTHTLIWAATDVGRLGAEARAAIEDGTNEVLVSVVSAWEIAIKQSLGKLDLARPAEHWLPEVLRRTGFEVAELSLSSALHVRGLAWHHKDPFDRLLIAQALEQGYTIVSRDPAFEAYGVPLLRA
ncbi:MAG: type II toxin-antitoxin system VapC family toxin [Deltaproteobacteria bacterium]|nr:MAG: type II toxin-antitoxin system VapC family toxin [Deltaproteobacteria bacterium]